MTPNYTAPIIFALSENKKLVKGFSEILYMNFKILEMSFLKLSEYEIK